MMNYYNLMTLPRDFTRNNWTKLWRIMRKHSGMQRDDTRDASRCAERAHVKRVLDKYVDEQGRVGIVQSGMDCDCVRYCEGRVYERMHVTRFVRMRDDMHEWADGPCSMSICAPRDLPESYSRDLAMEAFEDGHAHVVYY